VSSLLFLGMMFFVSTSGAAILWSFKLLLRDRDAKGFELGAIALRRYRQTLFWKIHLSLFVAALLFVLALYGFLMFFYHW